MKRKEEIRSAAQAHYPSGTNHEEIKVASFVRGARYADKTMIDKAYEYAEARYDLDYCENVRDVLNYLKSLVEE